MDFVWRKERQKYRHVCLLCERKRLRVRYQKNISYYKKRDSVYNYKDKARAITKNAIESGALIKKPCEVCGDIKVEGHHPDYSKPLEVNWLCKRHHSSLHFNSPSPKLEVMNNKHE